MIRNRAKYVIAAEMVLTGGRNGDNALMIVKRCVRDRLVLNGGGLVLVELVDGDVLIGCGSILVEMIGGQSSQLKGPASSRENCLYKQDFRKKTPKMCRHFFKRIQNRHCPFLRNCGGSSCSCCISTPPSNFRASGFSCGLETRYSSGEA